MPMCKASISLILIFRGFYPRDFLLNIIMTIPIGGFLLALNQKIPKKSLMGWA